MQITKRNAQATGRTCGNTYRNVELLLGVLLLALSASAQTVGSQRVAVTAAEGDSWLNHLHRSFDETSMGKTGRLGPSEEESQSTHLSSVSQAMSATPKNSLLATTHNVEADTVTLHGSDVYRLSCRGCHRESGEGAPPEIGSVLSPVRATSAALVRERMRSLGMKMSAAQAAEMATQSRTALMGRIRNGGEDMPALSHLSDAEIDALLVYLKQLAQVPDASRQEAGVTESRVRVGEMIVKSTCRVCHSAAGENPTPEQMAAGAIPPLSSLTARVDKAGLIRKVTQGAPVVMGNQPASYRGRMPVFFYLSEAEAADVYLYLAKYPPQTGESLSSVAMLRGRAAADDGENGGNAFRYFPADPLPASQRTRRPNGGTSQSLRDLGMLLLGLWVVALFAVGFVVTVREFKRFSLEGETGRKTRRLRWHSLPGGRRTSAADF
jgi:mono/diheme cytochrome c family protein